MKILYLPVVFLLLLSTACAAPENEYKITYTINVRDDGTAIWNVEYRTLLSTKDDLNSFENYTQQLDLNLNIGDAFVGGLYLSRDTTLIIQYPSGYTVEQVIPQPDQVRDGLIWYGLRSFGAGEPRIVLAKTTFPWIPLAVIIFIIAICVFIYMRKIHGKNAKDITENIAETDMMDLEDRILKLLKESSGSLYQSEIGRRLNLPKSTV
ncbi:MAG: hypothetical protein KJ714_10160, partial [Euryarchaeota archaeon]|nr:hypothetical protein [Euryarchaeota archaeon]